MKIVFDSFLGANSSISDKLLPPQLAVEATNVFTDQGALTPLRAPKQIGYEANFFNNPAIQPTWNTNVNTLNSIFLMKNNLWLAWAGSTKTSCALLQIKDNSDWQLAFTNTDIGPQYCSYNENNVGNSANPTITHPLGIPAPNLTLQATVSAKPTPESSLKISWVVAGTLGDTISNRIGRSYVYTYVNSKGREGPPSVASNIVYSNDDEQIILSNFSVATGQLTDIVGINIYVASSGGTFNFLKSITPPSSSVATITIADNTFGSAIETTLYDPPPINLLGLTAMANGMLAGYVDNNLYFSEPYQSHAWPTDYIVPMDYPIKGLASIGNMLYISTDGYPIIGFGNTPSLMTFSKLGSVQANVSDRSIVSMSNGAMYASPDGIVLLSNGKAEIISHGIISEYVYKLMNPSSIHAYFYRNKYIGFYDSGLSSTIESGFGEIIPQKGAFILDIERKVVTYSDIYCDTAFSDKVSGKLFVVKHVSALDGNDNIIYYNNLYEWNNDASFVSLRWKSKPILTKPINMAVAQILADSYTSGIYIQIYADDNLIDFGGGTTMRLVSSNNPFRLPAGYRAKKWAVRVQGIGHINKILLATSIDELIND